LVILSFVGNPKTSKPSLHQAIAPW